MERVQTASTGGFNTGYSTIKPVAGKMTESLIGTIIGSAGAFAAFLMRLILGNTIQRMQIMLLKQHAELKETMEREFRRAEHRLTQLEARGCGSPRPPVD